MEKILILRGQNALGKQKIQFLLQSSSNVNINTVGKLKKFLRALNALSEHSRWVLGMGGDTSKCEKNHCTLLFRQAVPATEIEEKLRERYGDI